VRSQEVARRYAIALYQLAAEHDEAQLAEEELRAVVDETTQTREISRYLAHPLVSRERKTEFVRAVFPDLSERMRNLFGLLIRNRREAYLDLIYAEFLAARAEAEGMVPVRVTTARPLGADERDRLTSNLERALKQRVRLEERIDEGLLGGARIETDGRVIDGSLRARLERLRARLET
jgi:F-type H+-transporting ATPase subunit delta